MITYKTCIDVTMTEIFEAFRLGFSDYIVPLTMNQDAFEVRFFGPEGNTLNLSFIALDQDRPIGLILGGIRLFDGLKTMRCGTLCLGPSYRGQGISHKLFEMHKSAALIAQCKQLFLEVIKENHRAIKFYEKYGYKQVYTLKYYSAASQSIPSSADTLPYTVKEISFDTLEAFRKTLSSCHINWQSDTPYYAASQQEALLGAYDGAKQIALIAMSSQGKINFLWVDPAYRNQELGSMMLQKAVQAQTVEKITICLPNNASLEGFLKKIGFQKELIEQYEMYLPL
ncbi:MAG: GNAT family N-acetyltransferase [Bacillota bacterium]